MVKGCQREMIVMQTQDSALFESAYLVLRREKNQAPFADMMAEANRIIGLSGGMRRRGRAGRKWLYFAAGVLLGAGIFALLRLCIGF